MCWRWRMPMVQQLFSSLRMQRNPSAFLNARMSNLLCIETVLDFCFRKHRQVLIARGVSLPF